MGKMLILLIAAAGIIFSIISLSINRSASSDVLVSVSEVSKIYAKNNSASGIEVAFRRLAVDSNWSGMQNKGLKFGSVTVTVQNTTSKYFNGTSSSLIGGKIITSIGSYNNYNDTVRAVLQLAQTNISTVPPFLTYSVASEENVSLGGNITISDDGNSSWNANIHTNKNFSMNGDCFIKGFVTYKGTATSNPSKRLETNIVPNSNPSNLDNHSQKPAGVTIPTFNPDDFKSKATMVYNSDATLSGNQSLGSKSIPSITYIDGDLNISGKFSGYGVFIVKGNVTISGNVTIDAGTLNDMGNNIGIYATGDVNIHATMRGQIMCNGSINVKANSQVYGGITAKGSVNFQGGADFFYRPATVELTKPFWPTTNGVTSAPKVISYYSN